MPASDAVNKQVCDYKASLGKTIKIHEQDKATVHAASGAGTAAPIATTPASADTAWGAAVMGTGPNAGYAVATGSNVPFMQPPGKTSKSYSVWNGNTYLWAADLDAPVTTTTTALPVDVVPRTRHQEQ
ncbi:hypothetical protein FK529_05420 [Tsukamurella asaccharolytica]|uniref:Uncharacterized protein n=1 Tax=Tsukamurella asaccharolytica TaxID=2592067 RepID=A0A5C5RCL3_9ACTN|nr:hypothetical protein [Tsukamurella asaccharolytica]TWS20769.1 hypothetical protein FK529_05420 [Tsukamurella asaccharolytica]